ncbi:hypothetical protein CC80DRAFT_552521 [Byssothecium circinans]|uniref:Uncharacterized protein n=1 Tax=Byssothecium circinans TaxID=147558 RepID=A0A6A5TI18_9PLEO|nr:hypothetical protein CC80DRAFT_552521 [Byssothecium circinans]
MASTYQAQMIAVAAITSVAGSAFIYLLFLWARKIYRQRHQNRGAFLPLLPLRSLNPLNHFHLPTRGPRAPPAAHLSRSHRRRRYHVPSRNTVLHIVTPGGANNAHRIRPVVDADIVGFVPVGGMYADVPIVVQLEIFLQNRGLQVARLPAQHIERAYDARESVETLPRYETSCAGR